MAVCVILGFCRLAAQQPVAAMAPSQELVYAAEPYTQTRAQPDDLTQADIFAYKIGMARAEQACRELQPTWESLARTPHELLTFAQLCNFGRQYDAARSAAQSYLMLPAPPEREKAYLVLIQSLLGLNDPADAAMEIYTLESVFPYDAKIHLAADETILAGALRDDRANTAVLGLCADESRNTLPLLEKGRGLEDKDEAVAPGTLFADAVRCFDIDRDLHVETAQATLTKLKSIAALPAWQHTAVLENMESALASAEMAGEPSPDGAIRGRLVRAAGPLLPVRIGLTQGTQLLILFTLWSPDAISMVRAFHVTAPEQRIYLLTSWAANTGLADEENAEVLDSLRSAAEKLPPRVSILVTSDEALERFREDAFPAAIVIRQGIVRANLPLVGAAGQRMTVLALDRAAGGLPAQRHATPQCRPAATPAKQSPLHTSLRRR